MKLVVGLGNPGKQYEKTRHNLGFMFLDFISKKYNLNFTNGKFNALESEVVIENEKVLFIKPQMFINLSGEVVKKYIDYYKLELSDILIIHDDLAMVLGKIKLVYNSRDGGHNGVKNINESLNSKEYLRLKIGIQNNDNIPAVDYVLGKFTNEEVEIVENSFSKIENIVEEFITIDLEEIKSIYYDKNNKIANSNDKK